MGFNKYHKVAAKIARCAGDPTNKVHLSIHSSALCWFFVYFGVILWRGVRAWSSPRFPCMFESHKFAPKLDRPPDARRPPASGEPKQRRMMVIALTLLLVALGFVLYRDRDFWFPDTPDATAEDQSEPAAPADVSLGQQATTASRTPLAVGKKRRNSNLPAKAPAQAEPAPAEPAAPPVTVTRTVLPPLEVEVVAGNVHRTVHPGSNSVRVDLQPGAPAQSISDGSAGGETASLTNAADRVQMSADTSEVVTRTVRPGYPLLARQMKVQGSVILQALISRDGDIQGLQVVSGPPILAGAAQEAVRQWRFKPHRLGSETVETQAKITVNFTISTN